MGSQFPLFTNTKKLPIIMGHLKVGYSNFAKCLFPKYCDHVAEVIFSNLSKKWLSGRWRPGGKFSLNEINSLQASSKSTVSFLWESNGFQLRYTIFLLEIAGVLNHTVFALSLLYADYHNCDYR